MEKVYPQKIQFDDDGEKIVAPKPGDKSQFRVWLALLLISPLLSGRVLDRFLLAREQMCDVEKYVSIETGNSVSLVLKEPVLLERDLYMIMDAQPTEKLETQDGVVINYVFEQLQASSEQKPGPGAHEIQLSFLFVPLDDEFRLAEISSSELPFELNDENRMNPENLTALTDQVCGVAFNPFKRVYEVELDRQMLIALPDRQMAIDWFGVPVDSSHNGKQLVYEYRLKGNTDSGPVARITASFDEKDDRPLLIETSFTRYRANLNVQSAEMQVGFQL